MVPHIFIRYEDFFLKPQETYETLFKFCLGVDNLTGTNVERRIQEVLKAGT